MPYTHAGIQLERLASGVIFIHQQQFTSKLEPYPLTREQTSRPGIMLQDVLKTVFRSLTCASLWACQTRVEELAAVTTLQMALQNPTMGDLMAINAVVRKLKNPTEQYGLYYWKLTKPVRVVTVSDASAANKSSNFAREGVGVLLAEDRVGTLQTDKDDFLDMQQVNLIGGKMHLLIGSSSKAKRISHSTSHAETLAAAKTIPLGQLTALRYAEPEISMMNTMKLTPMKLSTIQDDALCPVMHDHFIDCMDLWELACGLRGIPQDKSQRLGVLAIREERRTLRLRRFFHVRTHWMLVDMLTKHNGYVSKSLFELLTCGHWTIESFIRVRQHFGGAMNLEDSQGII